MRLSRHNTTFIPSPFVRIRKIYNPQTGIKACTLWRFLSVKLKWVSQTDTADTDGQNQKKNNNTNNFFVYKLCVLLTEHMPKQSTAKQE